jgi:CBS domain containing-hemolysin-like protein
VYRDSLDDIVGALHLHDLFQVLDRPPESVRAEMLLRPVLAVPETKRADVLLEEMRTSRRQLALVIDEYGGTAGIVTLEDLVEALVGQIDEEPPIGTETPAPVAAEPDGSIMVDGLTRLNEAEEITSHRLSEPLHSQVDTVGGLVMATLDRVPEVGDEVRVDGLSLRVEQLDGRRRVQAVRVTRS